jgi:hypothetical protein
MPEHVHLLLSEPEHGTLAEAIHYLKLSFAKRVRSRTIAQVSVQQTDATKIPALAKRRLERGTQIISLPRSFPPTGNSKLRNDRAKALNVFTTGTRASHPNSRKSGANWGPRLKARTTRANRTHLSRNCSRLGHAAFQS